MAKLTNSTIYGSANITGNVVSTGQVFDISANSGINISQANTITGVVITVIGAGYQSVPSVLFSNTTTGGVTANANAVMRISTAAVIGNVGVGYANGDVLYANNVNGLSNAFFTVTDNTAITFGIGGIRTLTVNNAGLFFTLPNYYNTANVLNTGTPAYLQITGTTSLTGNGANVNISASGFLVNNLYFSNYGSGYVEPPTITFSGGSPTSAAVAYPLIGVNSKIQNLSNTLDFYGANNVNILRLFSNNTTGYATNGITPALSIMPPQSNYGATTIASQSQLYFNGGGTSPTSVFGFTTGVTNPTITGSTPGPLQFGIGHTASAVNYLSVTGNTTTNAPTISSIGSDTNIGINFVPKGTGNVNLIAANTVISGNLYANAGITFADGTLQTTAATGSGGSSSGYLANSIIFANTTGYLSNTNGISFYNANNTLVASNISVPTIYTTLSGIVFPDGTSQATAASGAATDASARANTVYTQGVDVTQNSRMTIIENTNLSQNVRLDYSNTAITIIQGVDTTQNTRLTVIENTDLSQNARIDYSNSAITIIQGVDLTQNTNITSTDGKMQSAYNQANVTAGGLISANANSFYIQSGLNSANANIAILFGTDASQNVRLDYSNSAITIVQGVDITQNTRLTVIENTDLSQNVRIDYSNTAITIIQGTDIGQNNRMTLIENTDLSQNTRLDYSNNAITVIQGTDTSQNVRLDYSNTAITIVQGVDIGQNSRMTIIENTDLSQNVSISTQNNFITIIQGTDVGQNSRMTIIEGTDLGQNSRMTIIEGVDLTQNTNINNKLSLTGASNQTVSGNVTISQDLIVSGNLIITGNVGSQNVQQLAVADPLIVLGIGNYTSDTKDIGFAAHYNDGVVNAHSGIIRDSGTKEYYVFKGYTPEVDVTNNVDINDASFSKANLNASYFKGNLIATTAVVNGLELYNYSTAAYAQANVTAGGLITANANGVATDGKMQSAYNQANVTAGGLITANANSFYIQSALNSANANVVILFGTDASQNVRLDYSNSAITIVQGVDVTQNNRMTIIENTDLSQNVRLDYSNTAITIVQGVDTSQNARMVIIEGTDVGQNSRMVIIEGTDVGQNSRMVIIENTDLSQNVRLDFSNTRMTISDGVNASQNANIVSVQALANTDVTYTTPTAGSYGSSSLVPVVTVASNGRITSITTAAVSGSGSSSNSFSTIKVSGQPDLIANTSVSPLTLVAGSGISLSTVGTSNTLTISSTGGFSGGTIANQLIVANTLSSYSNSNNALQVSGGVGVANSVYVGNRVGFGNTSTSLAYTTYNSTFNSVDLIFG